MISRFVENNRKPPAKQPKSLAKSPTEQRSFYDLKEKSMKIKTIRLAALLALVFAGSVFAESKSKEELARLAVSADSAAQAEALKNLRALGQDGLDALVRTYAGEIAKFSRAGDATDEWKRVAFALDSVAAQKDAYASNLFWFTDFEEAKREAQETNKPILSLRLLGNLNEEFSCANSRFFRALLYSNAEVSKYLRENYVLHWKSVRPAPKVTIDFGDGRKIERTLTGNSIHYILDEYGEIIDALPGLYSPSFFLKYLKAARNYETKPYIEAIGVDKIQNTNPLFRYRRAMFYEITGTRNQTVNAAKVKLTEPENSTRALPVAERAVTKMMTERPILTGMPENFSRFEPQINLEDWKKLSKLYAAETKFDDASIAFIKRQNKQTGLTDAQFAGLLRNLAEIVALDTTRNEFLFHTKLYSWLNNTRAETPALESFNTRVYAELFKTPESDKWLGLYTTDVYTALDGNGIIK
jgi:hypothetical protein